MEQRRPEALLGIAGQIARRGLEVAVARGRGLDEPDRHERVEDLLEGGGVEAGERREIRRPHRRLEAIEEAGIEREAQQLAAGGAGREAQHLVGAGRRLEP